MKTQEALADLPVRQAGRANYEEKYYFCVICEKYLFLIVN